MQVTKRKLREMMVIDGLRGIDDDFENDSFYGLLLDKRVKAFHPNASPEDLDRIKERCRQELLLSRIKEARVEADGARRRLQEAQAKVERDRAKQAQTTLSKLSKRSSKKYEAIDGMLRKIAQAQPRNHPEVFEQLGVRRICIPSAEPFASAGGWAVGYQKNPALARAWLSKRWHGLGLPMFPRGPK
jgi:hypothetical protein